MCSHLEVRELIVDYLARRVSLSKLNDWILDSIWDMNDGPGQDLAYDVLRLLSEYSSGYLPLEDMDSQIASLVQLEVCGVQHSDIAQSTSIAVTSLLDAVLQLSDSRLRVAS